ncbi:MULTISPECIES: chemotaxis protein CheW [Bacillaceae]|uniref:Chemotaxis protein CheW n=1 Tax=Metabacillus endolithicus TaxID=1535204 RepID=A0ABW5BVD5_9BACI|nr:MULTISPECIES: chemotaxis protein CheW [Bacillaceae]PGT86688.1 chemotaxis protein CheW [Bacillus sp. AFS040349]UGB32694.1 chemotaxis protein CheW [Metabacillus sp. B2-18]UHA59272.1 chemotaxis protein CheW [Metabacillus litoralis]
MSEHISGDLKVIVFQLQDEEYGIPVQQVRSIEKVQHITRVPRTASYIKGVINLRGVVTPIIDLRKRFGLKDLEDTESTRMIIVSKEDMEVGFIVDAANDVIDIHQDIIEPAPEVVGAVEVEYIQGVAKLDKRLIVMIDLEQVLKSNDERSLLGV